MVESLTIDSSSASLSTESKKNKNRFGCTAEQLEQMRGKSLGLIVYEGMLMCAILYRKGNQLQLDLRQQSMEEMSAYVNKKIKSYDRTMPIVATTLEALFTLGTGGGGLWAAIGQAGAAAARGAGSQLQDGHQAALTGLDHVINNLYNELVRQYNQGSQDSKQQFSSILDMCTRLSQQEKEAFDKTASAGG